MKIAEIIGARPQFIKAAALTRAISAYNDRNPSSRLDRRVIHTGQHYHKEMSADFFAELGMPPPDHELGVRSGLQGAQTGRILEGVERTLLEDSPDVVLVYGDTNSTLAGALAAAKLHLPVAHIEAGVRSYNRSMSEEVNRVVTDHVACLLFCPSEQAKANLEKEGLTRHVYVTGDVMYDVFQRRTTSVDRQSRVLSERGLRRRAFAVATVHRAENTDDHDRLRKVFGALEEIARDVVPVVLPLHPRTKKALADAQVSLKSIQVLPPVSYEEMLCLQANARLILTDSGGMQKEAYWLQVPCITLRDETEWVETVAEGWNHVVGAESDAIVAAARVPTPANQSRQVYGDANAAGRIVELLVEIDSAGSLG